jgi:hypothetical protein
MDRTKIRSAAVRQVQAMVRMVELIGGWFVGDAEDVKIAMKEEILGLYEVLRVVSARGLTHLRDPPRSGPQFLPIR